MFTFCHVCQPGQKLIQFLLSIRQLATAAVIHAEAVHDAVDDEESVLIAGELHRQGIEQLQLVLQFRPSLA